MHVLDFHFTDALMLFLLRLKYTLDNFKYPY